MIECQSMPDTISAIALAVKRLCVSAINHNCAMSTLRERMIEARTEAELSQGALAKLVKCGQTTIASIENGRNQSSSILARVAAVLNVNALWLAEGKGAKRNADLLPSPDMQTGSKKAEFKVAAKTGSHSRPLVQTVCDLAEQINDDGLRELAGFARCLTGTHPVIKVKRA